MSAARSPFDLAGPTALATGGNQGLGRAFAIGPAEAGARVAIAGRSEERNQKVTAEAIDALGHIDILVNNAGTCYLCESWVVTDEQWDAVFDLNVKAH